MVRDDIFVRERVIETHKTRCNNRSWQRVEPGVESIWECGIVRIKLDDVRLVIHSDIGVW